MGVSLVLLLSMLLLPAPPRPASGYLETNPSSTVRNAVSIIDQKYLHAASNRAWKQARQALLAGRYQSAAEAYQALGKQLASVHDPELYLVNSREFRAREEELEAKRVGTGLASFAIDRDPSSGYARVVTAIDSSPAARAGIRPRDLIVSINGEPTREMSHEQILDALAAEAVGKVRLKIRRGWRTRRVTLEPSPRPLDAVQFSLKKTDGKRIGYIRVLLFTPDAGQRVESAVMELERAGVDGYVLDLRNNPGGSLPSAVRAATAFTAGVLGTEVRGSGRSELLTRGAPLTGKPLIVLINGGTASAAEMLAAALHDLHRAVLVGSSSFGRGRTQAYIPLSDGYGILVPTGEILTPDGQALKRSGIRPDLKVAGDFLPAGRIATRHDAQFERAVAVLQHS
jgi:carboxyl-terminal processing protease